MKIVKQENVIPFRMRPTLVPARDPNHDTPGPALFLWTVAASFAITAAIIAFYRIH